MFFFGRKKKKKKNEVEEINHDDASDPDPDPTPTRPLVGSPTTANSGDYPQDDEWMHLLHEVGKNSVRGRTKNSKRWTRISEQYSQ